MFQFIFILLLIIILVPVLLFLGVLIKGWNFITNFNNSRTKSSTGNSGFGGTSNRGNQSSSHSSNQQGNQQSHQKIFKEGQGEYVDFEEVD